ncbi:MAG TPA: 50S ribosomal protein L15 [Candidatus Cloacimonas sp.]|nr:MAG: 50S ribosomal protein L15 [Candidatus Cloacimonetes bacterium ADurb.Bin089]HPB18541.1 50S ribosomal protein L15 [Candidatus Cloacimonas sp.]HQO18019.1 50S ribosomal protein L15 [Candidatus Cloacimonas sp.]
MLTLSNLERPAGKKDKKRVGKGQGSGWGHQAGRGHKGKKARAGGNVPPRFEGGQMPLNRRLPKRGFKNIFRENYRILNLYRLQNLELTELDIPAMEKMGLIPTKGKKAKAPVKVLAGVKDEFTKTVTIKANAFSQRAKELIEKNGGKAEVM